MKFVLVIFIREDTTLFILIVLFFFNFYKPMLRGFEYELRIPYVQYKQTGIFRGSLNKPLTYFHEQTVPR